MIILDEKMPPPPPYTPPPSASVPSFPPPFSTSRERLDLSKLSPPLLLRIVYASFSQTSDIKVQRKTLYWLTMHLRAVNRAFYIACMHVLRSTYLAAYSELIRSPYTSDPFPQTSAIASFTPGVSPIWSLQRETRVLDLFIALKVREDVWTDESELHLERDESFRDLFDLMQPRSRMEDLVRAYGVREGLIAVGTDGTVSRSPTTAPPSGSRLRPKTSQLSFEALAVSFSPRRVGIVLTTRERKKTIVDVARRREEKLEVAAKALVHELRTWLATNA